MTRLLKLALAVLLTINPTNYQINFTPDPDNYELRLLIEGNKDVNPYMEFHTFTLTGVENQVQFMRRKLPKGSYNIQAEIMRWYCKDDKHCELYRVDASETLTIHIPN